MNDDIYVRAVGRQNDGTRYTSRPDLCDLVASGIARTAPNNRAVRVTPWHRIDCISFYYNDH